MLIAFDSNVLIYALNENPDYVGASRNLIARVSSGKANGVASVLALSEVMRKGSGELLIALQSIRNFRYLPVSLELALEAARIQKVHKTIRLVDAVHLATAITSGAVEFWTNDSQLLKLRLSAIKIKSLTSFAL